MRQKKERIVLENIEVVGIAAEGKSIARIDNKVVFVNNAIPGDIVNVFLKNKRKKFSEAIVTEIVKESPIAEKAFCEYFGTCGGCKWQRLPYAKQLEFKQEQVYDQLQRIAGLENPVIRNIVPSDKTDYYRNKLEFTFSNKRWLTSNEIDNNGFLQVNGLGFHVSGKFDKVIDIHKCYLQPEPSNKIRNFIREFAIENSFDFFDIREQTGFLRTLVLRTSSVGEVMVIIAFYRDDRDNIEALLEALKNKFPEITSLLYTINPKGNDTIGDLDILTYSGKDYIEEKMEDLVFRVNPKSFYQTNSEQAYKLYSLVRKYSDLTGSEVVYDLYTGTGTIANFLARKASKVVGIEYVPEAIEDAKVNSEINSIDNTSFFAGDMKNILTENFININGRPDVIVVDPPRAGLHPNVIDVILKTSVPKIIYVSCNPATQARDIQLFSEKYEHVESTPVDMFPHTHHVENVSLLVLK